MLLFLICFFGFAIKIRLYSSLFERYGFSKEITKNVFLGVLIFDSLILFVFSLPAIVWILQLFSLSGLVLAPRALEIFLEKQLSAIVVTFFDQIILSVQMGSPLRVAIKTFIDGEQGWKKFEIQKAFSSMMLSSGETQVRSRVLQNLFDELRSIDQSRNKTIEQLKSLRWHYKIQENFRRKSGQVAQQSRIQAVVVTILYVALLIFNGIHFGFKEQAGLIVFSGILFIVGLFLVFIIGRRIKWTV